MTLILPLKLEKKRIKRNTFLLYISSLNSEEKEQPTVWYNNTQLKQRNRKQTGLINGFYKLGLSERDKSSNVICRYTYQSSNKICIFIFFPILESKSMGVCMRFVAVIVVKLSVQTPYK